ncbi:MAG: TetR/AcrR family transcriptional regulator [Acidimicrobiales bacterium]
MAASQRRAQLIAAAQRLFALRGYESTTMEEIASAAGVTKPLLYQHFTSKRTLYLEIVEQICQEVLTALRPSGSGARGRIYSAFTSYFELLASHEDAFQILFSSHMPADSEVGDALRQMESSIISAIAGRMPESLPADQRRLLAHALVGMGEGGSRFWMERRGDLAGSPAPRAKSELHSIAQRLAGLAWEGLRAVAQD